MADCWYLKGSSHNNSVELADPILSHGRELENNHMPREGNSSEDPYEVVNRDQLIELQNSDDNLVMIREQVVSESDASREPVSYYCKSGLLMRRWRPPDAQCNEEWRIVNQVVVPTQLRGEILRLAHEGPLAGHLGINKTQQKILQHFYWPGLRTDVVQFCKTCHVCQISGKPNQTPPGSPHWSPYL